VQSYSTRTGRSAIATVIFQVTGASGKLIDSRSTAALASVARLVHHPVSRSVVVTVAYAAAASAPPIWTR